MWLVYAHLDERVRPLAVFSQLLMMLPEAISNFQRIRQRCRPERALSADEDLSAADG